MTRAPVRASLSRLRSIVRRASRSFSTKTALAAPRESASRPIAPEPANRSSTEAPSTGPIRLKAASRARSAVGRVSCPFGAKIRAPLFDPAMILMQGLSPNGDCPSSGTEAQPVLGTVPARGQSLRTVLRSRERVSLGPGEGAVDSHAGTVPGRGLSLKRHRSATRFRDSPRRDSPYETALRSRERVGLGVGEETVDLVVQWALVPHQFLGQRPCLLEQSSVGAQPGEAELGQAGLARAEQLALAAQLEILLRELEAIRRLDERLQPLAGVVGQLLFGPRDEQAVRLLGSAADAAPQLVELREAEPVGLLNDHDRRVRHVDADLDHRRRDEHVELACLEPRHQLPPVARSQAPVKKTDSVVPQLPPPQALRLGLRRT